MTSIKRNQLIFIALVIFLIFLILFKFISVLLPFVLGFALASLFEPVTSYFIRNRGVNKLFVFSLLSVFMFIILSGFLYYLIPVLLSQLTEFGTKLASYKAFSQNSIDQHIFEPVKEKFPYSVQILKDSIGNFTALIGNFAAGIFSNIFYSGKILFHMASTLLLTPIFTFYFACEKSKMMAEVWELVPRNCKSEANAIFSDLNRIISKYFKGQILVCAIMGMYYSIGLLYLKVEYAVVIGICSGISLFLPYVGISSSFIISVIFYLIYYQSIDGVLGIVILYMVGIFLESWVITPKIISNSLDLHPLWVFLGLFFWGVLFGFFGILLAIPLTAITSVFIKFVLSIYKESKLYKRVQ